jgi:uncharacterized protein YggE
MRRRFALVATGCATALLAVSSPAWGAASASGGSITASGTGESRVLPKDRNNNASIVAAYDAAKRASVGGAVAEAHEYAALYANSVGLTLGAVTSVSDQPSPFFGYGGPGNAGGYFGPGQFCGTIRQPIVVRTGHRFKIKGFKVRHRCFVPRFAYTTLSVTYSAS